ncbi:TPA: 5,10-methylenetetrahydrofolate reductase [Candidatus Bathyarchaeota archaeon]|nr:5,10-methylenetetrahydrofolate reductase [Candidatus Bathyarchaeota archaeon]
MMITIQKSMDEIEEMLKGYGRLFLIGCGSCSTSCETGGEKEVKEIVKRLEALNKKVTGYVVIDEACDSRLTRMAFRKAKAEIEGAEALLSLTCGIGTQVAAELSGKPAAPGANTLFYGKMERIGRFYEYCRACGDCLLWETGGICPIARCAKGLLNGPCGGQVKGKCEVGGWKKDCAWVLIYNKLKERGLLDLFTKFREPKDYRLAQHPRELSPMEA